MNKLATRKHRDVNLFIKEPMTYKAKVARKVIKVIVNGQFDHHTVVYATRGE